MGHYPALLLGLGLIFALAGHRPAGAHVESESERVLQGVLYLQTVLAVPGCSLLLIAAMPANWFRHPGLPRSMTGLRVGPDGWLAGNRSIWWTPLLAVLLFGAALRIYGLNGGLWIDEIATVVTYMRGSVWDILSTYESANQHAFNSLLGHFSIGLLGEHPWSIRLPAVVFGIGGLWALYFLARTITSEWEALLAVTLLAVSYHHVWFSQNARGYTAMLFWGMLGTGLFLRSVARNRARDWAMYVLSMALGVWSLLNTMFILAGHLAAYLLVVRHCRVQGVCHAPVTRSLLASQTACGLLIVLSYSLMIPSMIAYFAPEDSTDQKSGYSPVAALWDGITAGVGMGGLFAVGAVLILGSVGFAHYLRQSAFVATILVAPALFNVLAIILLWFPALPRSFLYVLPFGLLLVVRGTVFSSHWLAARAAATPEARRRWERALPLAVLAPVVVVSAVMLLHNYRYPKQDYRGALAYVRERQAGDDLVCAVGPAAFAYREYYAPNLCFPESVDGLKRVRRSQRTVWVLYSFRRIMSGATPELHRYVTRQIEHVAIFPGTLGDGDIHVARMHGAAEDVEP